MKTGDIEDLHMQHEMNGHDPAAAKAALDALIAGMVAIPVTEERILRVRQKLRRLTRELESHKSNLYKLSSAMVRANGDDDIKIPWAGEWQPIEYMKGIRYRPRKPEGDADFRKHHTKPALEALDKKKAKP